MSNCKIFVTYSNTPNCLEFSGSSMNEKFLEKKDIYVPILGGKKLYKGSNEFFKNMKGDDEGKNVSHLNSYVNEHSVIYWVGNHLDEIDDEYIGFCHYRRLFDVPDGEKLEKNVIFVNKYAQKVSNASSFILMHDPKVLEKLSEFIHKYSRSRENPMAEYSIFANFLDLNIFYSANMFIMYRDKFKEYMKIMSDIYNIVFNMIIPIQGYSDRSYGYILERMSSYVIMKMQVFDKELKIKQGKYLNLDNAPT